MDHCEEVDQALHSFVALKTDSKWVTLFKAIYEAKCQFSFLRMCPNESSHTSRPAFTALWWRWYRACCGKVVHSWLLGILTLRHLVYLRTRGCSAIELGLFPALMVLWRDGKNPCLPFRPPADKVDYQCDKNRKHDNGHGHAEYDRSISWQTWLWTQIGARNWRWRQGRLSSSLYRRPWNNIVGCRDRSATPRCELRGIVYGGLPYEGQTDWICPISAGSGY